MLGERNILRPRTAVDLDGALRFLEQRSKHHEETLAAIELLYRELAQEHQRLALEASLLPGERGVHAQNLADTIAKFINERFPRILEKAQTDEHRANVLLDVTEKILLLTRGESPIADWQRDVSQATTDMLQDATRAVENLGEGATNALSAWRYAAPLAVVVLLIGGAFYLSRGVR